MSKHRNFNGSKEIEDLSNRSLIHRAARAHFRWCKQSGSIQDQPGNDSGVEEHDGEEYVVLRNVKGVLAIYHYKDDGILSRVENLDPSGWTVARPRRSPRNRDTAKQAPTTDSLNVSSTVYNSWGYGQTSIDFYEITRKSSFFVWLRRLMSTTEETGFMCGNTEPIVGVHADHSITKHKVRPYWETVSINFRFGCGSVWDGQPKECSWYA